MPSIFRRDKHMIPNEVYQLERINRMLKKVNNMIVLKNPETGERHEMDTASMDELKAEVEHAENCALVQLQFRGMFIETATARKIVDGEI